jgi:hypothetical protein
MNSCLSIRRSGQLPHLGLTAIAIIDDWSRE